MKFELNLLHLIKIMITSFPILDQCYSTCFKKKTGKSIMFLEPDRRIDSNISIHYPK